VTSGGVISTLAGNGDYGFSGDGGPAISAQLHDPWDVALDAVGNVFVADTYNHAIRRVSIGGVITTVAGNGTSGFSGDGGVATSAQLNQPTGIALDAVGNMFIADGGNFRVRKVTPGGAIDTVAGGGVGGFTGDGGQATSAKLNRPLGVALDRAGNLFIADYENERVRKVMTGGIINTVAGGGTHGLGDGGPATAAWLHNPAGVAVDAAGNLFIAETWSSRVRKVTADGVITTVAGNGVEASSGDGGPATSAGLDFPEGVATDGAGNLFIAEFDSSRIRKVTTDGIIHTVAGGGTTGLGDGGPAASAQLKNPEGIAVDLEGNLIIPDTGNNRVRKVTPDGMINTIAGNGTPGFAGDGGRAIDAQLNGPCGVAVDGAGNLYIADTRNERVRRVTTSGIINTVAGDGTNGFAGDGGPATSAQLDLPIGVAVDGAGDLFIADSNNMRVRKVVLESSASTFFPQVAVGGGYSTLFTIVNTGATNASADLILTDQQGSPFQVSAALIDSSGTAHSPSLGATFTFEVPSGGIVFLTAVGLTATQSVKVGWAQMDSTGGLLTAVATYQQVTGGSLQTAVGVLQSEPLQFATIPVNNDSTKRLQTAYAIANQGSQTISVQLGLVDQNGTIIDDTITVELGPKQQIARYVWQDLARTNFIGSLVIRGKGSATFVAVALIDNQGLLTAIPIIPGNAPGVPD
jgi:sugar lactone lactonase YvrE